MDSLGRETDELEGLTTQSALGKRYGQGTEEGNLYPWGNRGRLTKESSRGIGSYPGREGGAVFQVMGVADLKARRLRV